MVADKDTTGSPLCFAFNIIILQPDIVVARFEGIESYIKVSGGVVSDVRNSLRTCKIVYNGVYGRIVRPLSLK